MPTPASDIKFQGPVELEDTLPLPMPSSQDPNVLQRYIDRLNVARDERSIPRKEFDGMTFEQDYERNRECTYSYLRPKRNDDDVRVNSGTAEKKIELMLNELLAMNFQPEVRAYDEHDMEIVDLGVDFTDLVRDSNERETDEDLWEEVYLDLLTQRVAFVEECLTDVAPGGYATTKSSKKRGVKRRISPLQVYFGDMYIPVRRFNEQPYLVVYDRMLIDEAELLWGDNSEWQYVRAGANIHDEYIPWFKYRFSTLRQDEVEIITYMSSSAHEDDYQVIINGVMMFPNGKAMPMKNGYPIKASTVKMIPDFAYGKPPIASAKFLQALQDETLRNFIRKMRQAIEPPIGVKTGKIPTRDMWSPAAVTQGITGDNFSKLIDHDGVTTSEFQMYNLIVQKTEEFIGPMSISNQAGAGSMTATQIIELQKQAIKMIGLAVMAIIRLKRDVTFLRLETFVKEYTKPLSQSVKDGKVDSKYRSFELTSGRTTKGETVRKFVSFVDRVLSSEEMDMVRKAEDKRMEQDGVDTRYSFINVRVLNAVPILFKVVVTPESRDSGSLDKVMFQDRLMQAVQIMQFTGRRLNSDKLVEDFERTWKVKNLFESGTGQAGGMPPDPQSMLASLQGMQGGPQQPQPKPGQSQPNQPQPSAQGTDLGRTVTNLVKQPQ